MDSKTTGDLVVRTARWRSVTMFMICGIVLAIFPVATVASLLRFRASGELGNADPLGGLVFIEPAALLITARVVLEVRNTSLVLNHSDLVLTDWRGRRRSIPRQSITGVWSATLPKRMSNSDVRTTPRKMVVVTGSDKERPILLCPERFPSTDMSAVWERLGRVPTDLGKLTDRELDKRFPGTAMESIGEMLRGWLGWILAYVAVAAVMLVLLMALMVLIGGMPIQVLWRRA